MIKVAVVQRSRQTAFVFGGVRTDAVHLVHNREGASFASTGVAPIACARPQLLNLINQHNQHWISGQTALVLGRVRTGAAHHALNRKSGLLLAVGSRAHVVCTALYQLQEDLGGGYFLCEGLTQ